MPASIKMNSTDIVVTPLFDMQHKEMLHSYRKGIRCQIQNESGLRPIQELVYFLQEASRTNLFDRKQAADIYQS